MKTSPFKIYGGVTPLKQDPRLMVTASNGVSVPKANLKDYENSLKEANKDIAKENIKNKSTEPIVNENLLNVIPGSGEIVDAKNAIKDFVDEDYGGAALNMAGFFLPFVPGGVLKAGGKSIMNYLKKMPGVDDFLKSGKKMTKEQEINFKKGFAEADGNPIAGGVGGGGTDIKDYTLPSYGKYSDKNYNNMQTMLRDRGANLDEFVKGKGSTVYNKQNTKLLGSDGGRQVVEVSLPNGETQKFYKSTGLGKKVDSKDRWIPIDGTQTNARGGEWFNKGGSQATYKGEKYKGYENSAGEYVSVETQLKAKGVNIKEAMKSGSLKIDESGYDFDYGSTEFRNISKQLSTIY
tara:strand:+ start:27 stop:1073 length:1047 start_codon:yes stop_codon:yes gene_type:complete